MGRGSARSGNSSGQDVATGLTEEAGPPVCSGRADGLTPRLKTLLTHACMRRDDASAASARSLPLCRAAPQQVLSRLLSVGSEPGARRSAVLRESCRTVLGFACGICVLANCVWWSVHERQRASFFWNSPAFCAAVWQTGGPPLEPRRRQRHTGTHRKVLSSQFFRAPFQPKNLDFVRKSWMEKLAHSQGEMFKFL